MKEIERHYGTKEVCKLLSVHSRTVTRWIADGRLSPVVLIGARDLRIPASAVERFIAHRTINRGASAL